MTELNLKALPEDVLASVRDKLQSLKDKPFVSETCRFQNRSIYDYLFTAVKAHLKQQPFPSLLPGA